MRAADWQAADSASRELIARHPRFAAGWLAASQIALALKRPEAALESIDRALALEPANVSHLIHRAKCLMVLRRRGDALQAITTAERCAPDDPAVWDAIGSICSHANDQRRALAAYNHAVALAPHVAHFLYNRASVRRFLGDLEGAETDYDRVIALSPTDFEAYVNRSELRVQTAQRNHIQELEATAAQEIKDWRGEVQIRFALAKEYEDLGDYANSFEQLRRGARKRREHLKYDVAVDVATVDWIIEAFPAIPAVKASEANSEDPIFIVGLPRSGTTLVERILGSHSLLISAGELDCFALAIVDAVRKKIGRTPSARRELVALSATLDFTALGRDYLARARSTFEARGRFIDKMPLNYLYCGLIHRALPNAKIIHVTRHPMAVGYAMYKTLFKGGYPFSYDLREIGRYYVAYRRLMQHWQAAMPGLIYELAYEDLVADLPAKTRSLLAYCGLPWEDRCVSFHQNPSASTTASASQVRRPVYNSSVAQWKHYEERLTELKEEIASAGYGL